MISSRKQMSTKSIITLHPIGYSSIGSKAVL